MNINISIFLFNLKRMKARLSDQREKVLNGSAPLPLYTCLHVKSNVSAMIFQVNIIHDMLFICIIYVIVCNNKTNDYVWELCNINSKYKFCVVVATPMRATPRYTGGGTI